MRYWHVPQRVGVENGMPSMVPNVEGLNGNDLEHVLIHKYPEPERGAIIGCEQTPLHGVELDTTDSLMRAIILTNGGALDA